MATIFDRVVNYKEKQKATSDGSAPKPATVQPSTKGGILVYMKVSVGKRNVGRMVFELFYDETPKTAENFRVLCTGERGLSPISGKPLHYKGSTFHRIIRGFMAQAGDFTHGNGTGGESIYGSKFADEDFTRKHVEPGLLSMANAGPNTNGSQFFVTFQATPHLDDKHVVFGKLVEGKHVLSALEVVATNNRDKPRMAVTITDCGQLGEQDEPEDDDGAQEESEQQQRQVEPKQTRSGMSQSEMSMAIVSGLQSFAGRGRKAKRRKTRPRDDEEEEEEEVAQPPHSVVVASSAPTSATPAATEQVPPAAVRELTPRERRLQELREKIRQARHKNKQETRKEYKKVSDPNYEKKRKREEWLEYKSRKQRDMEKRGRSEADDYLDKSATQLMRGYRQRDEKARNRAAFGWNVFNQDTIHKANQKRLNALPQRGSEGNVVTDLASMGGPQTSKAAVRELSKSISAQQEKRKKFSRRRRHNPDADVDYINDRNAHFNKKIGRAFDKYTVEIRQNLERGTAL